MSLGMTDVIWTRTFHSCPVFRARWVHDSTAPALESRSPASQTEGGRLKGHELAFREGLLRRPVDQHLVPFRWIDDRAEIGWRASQKVDFCQGHHAHAGCGLDEPEAPWTDTPLSSG
jgi:hypothetical protein